MRDNGLMEGDVYSLLFDFTCVIRSIQVALEAIGPSCDIVVQSFVELSDEYLKKFNEAYKMRNRF